MNEGSIYVQLTEAENALDRCLKLAACIENSLTLSDTSEEPRSALAIPGLCERVVRVATSTQHLEAVLLRINDAIGSDHVHDIKPSQFNPNQIGSGRWTEGVLQ